MCGRLRDRAQNVRIGFVQILQLKNGRKTAFPSAALWDDVTTPRDGWVGEKENLTTVREVFLGGFNRYRTGRIGIQRLTSRRASASLWPIAKSGFMPANHFRSKPGYAEGGLAVTRREVMRMVFEGKKPPYVPWSFSFTAEALEKLKAYYGKDRFPGDLLWGHFLSVGRSTATFMEPVGNDQYRDGFGVVWDRSVDKDIGVVRHYLLQEPSLKNYNFPDPLDPRCFADIPQTLASGHDGFRVFSIGFSLYERAWSLRGMENLMIDFYEHPEFVHELLGAIADHNIAQIRKALEYEIDAVYFGDDWGSQHGLQMGPACWREFIKPQLARMYGVVRRAGRFVTIHSCGKVQELFDDLIEIGLNGFNPFQPEVMDVQDLMQRYRGRLTFIGGLSTQRTLPFGTVEDVKRETRWLLDLGREGSYVFCPAHSAEGDVPLENMLAFIEEVQNQPGYFGPRF